MLLAFECSAFDFNKSRLNHLPKTERGCPIRTASLNIGADLCDNQFTSHQSLVEDSSPPIAAAAASRLAPLSVCSLTG